MGAADRRRILLERHRELVSRHDLLDRAGPDSDRYEDLFFRVVDATDDLIHDLDADRRRAAARRRTVAFTLAAVAPAPLGLVAAGTVPSLWLAGAAVVAAAAAVLWLTSRPVAPDQTPQPGDSAPASFDPAGAAPTGFEAASAWPGAGFEDAPAWSGAGFEAAPAGFEHASTGCEAAPTGFGAAPGRPEPRGPAPDHVRARAIVPVPSIQDGRSDSLEGTVVA